jgi:predicted NUDIX family phosphoesterase
MSNETVLCITNDPKFKWATGAMLDGYAASEFIRHYQNELWRDTCMLPRSVAEHSHQFLQVIPYIVVFSRDTLRVLQYRRTKKGGDERLYGNWSVGVGGHINLQDAANGKLSFSAMVNRALLREFNEEFAYDYFCLTATPAGLIYDDSNDVGRVHIGIVYYATASGVYCVDTERHTDFGFVSLNDINEDEGYESWSRLLIKELRK